MKFSKYISAFCLVISLTSGISITLCTSEDQKTIARKAEIGLMALSLDKILTDFKNGSNDQKTAALDFIKACENNNYKITNPKSRELWKISENSQRFELEEMCKIYSLLMNL